jgi:hypothetical protein
LFSNGQKIPTKFIYTTSLMDILPVTKCGNNNNNNYYCYYYYSIRFSHLLFMYWQNKHNTNYRENTGAYGNTKDTHNKRKHIEKRQ